MADAANVVFAANARGKSINCTVKATSTSRTRVGRMDHTCTPNSHRSRGARDGAARGSRDSGAHSTRHVGGERGTRGLAVDTRYSHHTGDVPPLNLLPQVE